MKLEKELECAFVHDEPLSLRLLSQASLF